MENIKGEKEQLIDIAEMKKGGNKEQLFDKEDVAHRPAHSYNRPGSLFYAIVVTVFCCWPLGVVAIWKSAEANEMYARGEKYEASVKARVGRRLAHASVGVGLLVMVLIILFYIHIYHVFLERMNAAQIQGNSQTTTSASSGWRTW